MRYEAVQDFQNAAKVSRGIRNGKAAPRCGSHNEIYKIIINPNNVFVKQQYGFDAQRTFHSADKGLEIFYWHNEQTRSPFTGDSACAIQLSKIRMDTYHVPQLVWMS